MFMWFRRTDSARGDYRLCSASEGTDLSYAQEGHGQRLGFEVHVIWECDVKKDPEKIPARLKKIASA
jgi:G:T-mismatch repair DNA endonuclease (very short patch repair protein)